MLHVSSERRECGDVMSADEDHPETQSLKSQVQDLRLRLAIPALARTEGEGQDGRRGALHQEHGHRARAFASGR